LYKITLLLIAAIPACTNSSWSQKKLSLSAFTGSGISYFRGSGTVNNSVYYRNGLPWPNSRDSMANPYGRKALANWVAGLQGDIIFSSKWKLLLRVQFESSGGKLTGDSVISPAVTYKTNGTFTRYYHYISFNPQIGRIIFQKVITLTLHSGMDYTSKLDRGENFVFTDQSGRKNDMGGQGDEPEVNDLRITLGASLQRKKWSIAINYKQGLVNYNNKGAGNVYSRILHFSIHYAVLHKNF
jgi:hypothetical protein